MNSVSGFLELDEMKFPIYYNVVKKYRENNINKIELKIYYLLKDNKKMSNDKSKKRKTNNIDRKELWNVFDNEIENPDKQKMPLECIYRSSGNREMCERCESILAFSDEGFLTCTNSKCGIIYKDLVDQKKKFLMLLLQTRRMLSQKKRIEGWDVVIDKYTDITMSLKQFISNEDKTYKYIVLPKLDYYNEIIFSVLLQKLAYEISIAKDINPDKPRNLAKVVTVE